MRILDLFSGIGGFALAGRTVGWADPVQFCEIEPFCQQVLKKNFPGVPIHDDVKTLRGQSVDMVCGGFPCQPHSVAGKRKGKDDERNLWPEFIRIVRESRPRWVVAENVPGILSTIGHQVVHDLEDEGYQVWPVVLGAWTVGAPHKRERVLFVALDHTQPLGWGQGTRKPGEEEEAGCRRGEPGGAGAELANNNNNGQLRSGIPDVCGESVHRPSWSCGCSEHSRQPEELAIPSSERREESGSGYPGAFSPVEARAWPARPGNAQESWEAPRIIEWPLGPAAYGIPGGLVRVAGGEREILVRKKNKAVLRAAGNAVVPQIIAAVFRSIQKVEESQVFYCYTCEHDTKDGCAKGHQNRNNPEPKAQYCPDFKPTKGKWCQWCGGRHPGKCVLS